MQTWEPISGTMLKAARQRVIRLPFLGAIICGLGWLLCIPVFIFSLTQVTWSGFATALALAGFFWSIWFHFADARVLSGRVGQQLGAVSGTLSACSRRSDPWSKNPFAATPRTHLGDLCGHLPDWIFTLAELCARFRPESNQQWLAVFVGSIGIAFGLCTAMMVSRLFLEPIDYLRSAAQAVARGRLDVEVPLVRADEFGLLIGEFNHMIVELRDKERLRRTFGLHVGQKAAEAILARDPGLGGVEEIITVMFVDIRSFTAMSAAVSPRRVVEILNKFLRVMVQVVEERHGGMVNKFLGDGFLALFGVGGSLKAHADAAVAAALDMLRSLPRLNRELALGGEATLAIGIGIDTGPAIVGSIGSPNRLEYTAIGSTVNFASRVQGLTKELGAQLLVTESTRNRLNAGVVFKDYPPQTIRGVEGAVKVFSIVD